MKKQINLILNDLYAIDPSLREHEAELRPLVAKLLEAKPDTRFDAAFAKQLRSSLMAEQPSSSSSSFFSFMQALTSNKWVYSFGGAMAAIVLMLPVVYFSLQNAPASDLGTVMENIARRDVVRNGSNAFGSLASLAETARPQSGGGGGGVANLAMDSSKVDSRIWLPTQTYRLAYNGDPIDLTAAELEVFKRIKDMGNTSGVARTLASLGGGIIDLSSFGNTEVRNVELFQNVNEGYSFGVNFIDGTVYVNATYERWFTDSYNCGRTDCPQPAPLRIEEVPADQVLLDMANAFIAQHGINVSSYGTPFVDQAWRISYDNTPDKSIAYIPDVVDVVYPLMINGEQVTDTGGNPYGLRIQISVRSNKVYGLWGLTTQRYESGSYAAEQDASRIITLAEQGGLYNYMGEPQADAVTVNLGTPTRKLMQYVRYVGGTNEELYVPALVFPVNDAPKDIYAPAYVVVPLVKEVLDNYQPPMWLKEAPASVEPTNDPLPPADVAQPEVNLR